MIRHAKTAISLVLAGVFIYAGLDKLRDPLQFADSVAAFGMLPNALVTPFALGLPVFEVLCGLMVLLPPIRRIAALALTLVIAMFIVALVSALARGLTLDCGCFGAGAPFRASIIPCKCAAAFSMSKCLYWPARLSAVSTPQRWTFSKSP